MLCGYGMSEHPLVSERHIEYVRHERPRIDLWQYTYRRESHDRLRLILHLISIQTKTRVVQGHDISRARSRQILQVARLNYLLYIVVINLNIDL